MKKYLAFFPLLVFAGLAYFFWRGLSNDPHHLASPLIGKRIPVFYAMDLWDSHRNLTDKLFQGHVSILNVFASWCQYCLQEQAVINEMADFPELVIYGLNYKDKAADAKKWLKRYGNPFRSVIFDPQGQLAIDFGVYGTPETFIIDSRGMIRYKKVGPITRQHWQQVMVPLLKHLTSNNLQNKSSNFTS